jgi:hypothetical protein
MSQHGFDLTIGASILPSRHFAGCCADPAEVCPGLCTVLGLLVIGFRPGQRGGLQLLGVNIAVRAREPLPRSWTER